MNTMRVRRSSLGRAAQQLDQRGLVVVGEVEGH
jgi:hypothetical protein